MEGNEMKTSILNKLDPTAREEVIRMEARLRVLDETIAYLDKMEEVLDQPTEAGLL
jgi:hypothetical protein